MGPVGQRSIAGNRFGDRRAGVTLLEMMIVVIIIGVVAAMAVPGMLTWGEDERVKRAARAVADAFSLARSEAIRTGNNHLVVFANGLGATQPIAIVNDGPAATANCTIDANEVVHEVAAEPDVSWGTSTSQANGTSAPDDTGLAAASIPAGTSFTDASMNPSNPATWVLYQSDGLPRLFTAGGGGCTAVGNAGAGGGAIYLSNGRRDYAVVLRPLGTARLHRWQAESSSWSN